MRRLRVWFNPRTSGEIDEALAALLVAAKLSLVFAVAALAFVIWRVVV